MKIKIIFLLIGSILFIQNCAPSKVMKMTAVASLDQKTGYDGTITSQKKHFVSLSPYTGLDSAIPNFDLSKYKTMFMMSVQNYGKEPINISYDDISVIFEGDSKDYVLKRIDVQSSDDFMNDLEEEYNKNEKRYLYSTLYNIYICSLSPYCPVYSKLEEFKISIETMRRQNQILQDVLPGVVLESQFIMPGNNYSAIVVCDMSDVESKTEGNFRIAVSIDGEEHKFTFKRDLSSSKK